MEVLEHRRSGVEEELADIAIFLLSFPDVAGIDLAEAVQAKVKKNVLRYPVETYRGSNAKAPLACGFNLGRRLRWPKIPPTIAASQKYFWVLCVVASSDYLGLRAAT
jgi:hypothetical protein